MATYSMIFGGPDLKATPGDIITGTKPSKKNFSCRYNTWNTYCNFSRKRSKNKIQELIVEL